MRNAQYAIRNTQCAMRNTQYAIRNTQYAIRNTQYAIRKAGQSPNTQYAYAIRNTQGGSKPQYAIRIRNTQYAVFPSNWFPSGPSFSTVHLLDATSAHRGARDGDALRRVLVRGTA